MNKVIPEELENSYREHAYGVALANAKRLQMGMVSQCDYVKGLLTTISLHALSNLIIFDCDRREKLIGICNTLRHG